jgi:ABC-2 type transport system ATP-binding protein
MSTEAIKIRGLTKSFPGFELGPLDLTVPTGAIYGLVGPNGAGKSTTIDLLMGMGAPASGTMEVFGLDHRRDEVAVKAKIGYVSPELVFNAWRKIGPLIQFIRAFYPDWDDVYCAALMQRLKLDTDDRIATLSFGARTKLALLLALSHRPALLLLDEPMSGLDTTSKQMIYKEFLDVVQDEARTVLISSHDLHDLERFADHIGILNKGKLLLEGPTDTLVNRFVTVDATTNGQNISSRKKGVYRPERAGHRTRMLVDTEVLPLAELGDLGITDIVTAPVTLEELFVGLVDS